MVSDQFRTVNRIEVRGAAGRSENQDSTSTQRKILFGSIRRWWWLYSLCLVAAGVSAYFIAERFSQSSYSVKGIIVQNSLPIPANLSSSFQARLSDAVRLAKSDRVLDRLKSTHGLSIPTIILRERILKIKSDSVAETVEISLEWGDDKDCVAMVNDVMRLVIEESLKERKDALKEHKSHLNKLVIDAKDKLSIVRADYHKASNPRQLAMNTHGSGSVRDIAVLLHEKENLKIDLAIKVDRLEELNSTAKNLLADITRSHVKFRRQQLANGNERIWDRDRSEKMEALQVRMEEFDARRVDLTLEEFPAWLQEIQFASEGILNRPSSEFIAELDRRQATLQQTVASINNLHYETKQLKQRSDLIDRDLKAAREPRETSQQSDSSERLDKLDQEKAFAENKTHELDRLWGAVDQLEQCPIADFRVDLKADLSQVIKDSDFLKIVAVVFVGLGGLLCLPVLAIDFLRHREDLSAWAETIGLTMMNVGSGRRGLAAAKNSTDHALPALRLLALRIQQSVPHDKGAVVLLSSLDGTSNMPLIAKLADCFAKREEKVLVIDLESGFGGKAPCSLEPSLTVTSESDEVIGEEPMGTISTYLSSSTSVIDPATISTLADDIDMIPFGAEPLPAEALASRRLTDLIDACRQHYTMVLVSGPPTSELPDLQMAAARCDSILLRCKTNFQRKSDHDLQVHELFSVSTPLIGLVSD